MTNNNHTDRESFLHEQNKIALSKIAKDFSETMKNTEAHKDLNNIINNMSKTTTKGFDVPEGFPIPLSKSVILAKYNKEFKTKGGLFLNESAEENNVAILMAVAEDCNPILKPGMKVMYNINEKREILFDDTTYKIMSELSLFCILPDTAVLMPETIHSSVKKTQEFRAEEKRIEAATKRSELNLLDKVKEQGKKKFHKRK